MVSLPSLTPLENRVKPMSLRERQLLGAVPRRGICSTIPGVRASDGLISGNGKMYIEVLGNPFAEQIVFHQERLVVPWKNESLEAPKIANVLPEVRRLIIDKQYRKANELALATASEGQTKPDTRVLMEYPAFRMRIDTPGQHAVHDYLRTIDFESGEVKVRWADSAGTWERRAFASRSENVVAQLLTAPAGASIHTRLSLDTSNLISGPLDEWPRVVTERVVMSPTLRDPGATAIRFEQRLDSRHILLQSHYVVDHGNPGYASVTRAIADGGSVRIDGNTLVVDGASSLTLMTRIQAYDDLKQLDADALGDDVNRIALSYDELLRRDRPGQANVIDRVSLNLGGGALHSMSGEEMLSDQRTRQGYNPALLENIFDMGRYWLYLRTGDFPPMWGDVNINVNLQMSGAVMGNLPEAIAAYTRWTEGLLPDSRVNARNIFGARGALFPVHPTQRGGQATHFAFGWPHEYWISAGGWMYSPMWDYYLATGDKEYLSQDVMPGLKEIALFYEDFLTEKDKNGKFIFVPSYSPENWPSNTDSSPTVINADMDIMVCREVFRRLIAGSEILGTNSDDIPRWEAMLAKLPPYVIDADGSLKEWAWPDLEERTSLDHRHLSHMYGVWPGDEITVDETPALASAAWLAARKRAQGNAASHGLLHRALTAARLKDPYLLNMDLKQLLEQGYVNPSLTTLSNPYSYASPDAQGALPTILMEMLVYSRPGVIGLLPALPATLSEGSVKGVVCRTEAKIDDLTWNLNTGTLSVTISSLRDQDVKLFVGGGIEGLDAPRGVLLSEAVAGSEEVDVRLSRLHPITLHLTLGRAGTAEELRAGQHR